jgi:hypothetical protein
MKYTTYKLTFDQRVALLDALRTEIDIEENRCDNQKRLAFLERLWEKLAKAKTV